MNSNYFWTLLAGVVIGVLIALRYTTPPHQETPTATATRVEIHYDTIRLTSIAPTEVQPLEVQPSQMQPLDMQPLAETPDTTSTEAHTPPSPLALYTFRDTVADRWSAQIVGRNVELQSLTITNPTPHHYTTEYRPPRWEITAQSHISRFTQWVGLEASHNIGRMRLSAHVGYAPHLSSLTYGATVGVALWSCY
ncbi:MAG: hypothetical protein SNH63_02570 [Rikenellaceae bacterium]